LLAKTSDEVSQILTSQAKVLEDAKNITGIATEVMDRTILTFQQIKELLQVVDRRAEVLITLNEEVKELKEIFTGNPLNPLNPQFVVSFLSINHR
jgi:hypothetical protein